VHESDSKGKDGRTPLWRVADDGHEVVVKLLLEKGADSDKDGQMPLWRAAGNRHEAVVKRLLEKGTGPDSKSNSG
jgi:ankyrin repeat protein